MELFKNTVKNTMLLFVVGVIVAAVMPLAANGLDAMGLMTAAAMNHFKDSVAASMATGLIFGGFGAFHTLLQPTFDSLFEGRKAQAASEKEKSCCKGHGHGHGVTINNTQMDIAADVEVDAKSHIQALETERAATGVQLQLIK